MYRVFGAIGAGARSAILGNHGLLTVGATVDAVVGYFLPMERCAEIQVKALGAQPIGAESARRPHDEFDEIAAWQVFQWAQRTHVPDVGAVGA